MEAKLPREQAGVVVPAGNNTTSYLGLIIFCGSWTILFAGLFMSYAVLRIRSPMWPPAGTERVPLLLPILATVVIALSSVTMQQVFRVIRV